MVIIIIALISFLNSFRLSSMITTIILITNNHERLLQQNCTFFSVLFSVMKINKKTEVHGNNFFFSCSQFFSLFVVLATAWIPYCAEMMYLWRLCNLNDSLWDWNGWYWACIIMPQSLAVKTHSGCLWAHGTSSDVTQVNKMLLFHIHIASCSKHTTHPLSPNPFLLSQQLFIVLCSKSVPNHFIIIAVLRFTPMSGSCSLRSPACCNNNPPPAGASSIK